MFSGLTNQVSSWIGAAKGEPQDEEVPTPPNSAATTATATTSAATAAPTAAAAPAPDASAGAAGDGGDKSPTKGGVFSGVSSKVTGWLGNASIPSMPTIPTVSMPAMPAMPSMPSIPGLRKTNQTDENGGIANEGLVTSPEKASQGISGSTDAADEEDRSRYISRPQESATGGADSRPATGPGTPTEENAGQIGQVTHKVTAGAKSIGSFLYSSFNKAGDKIKHLKDNSILGEFSKEQEAFIKNQQGGSGAGVCPWIGHANEAKIKEEILSLSADRRNFVRAPPAGVEFEFDYDSSYPVALAIMNDDKELEKMRFELVPKIITEESFWRNYFYRVSLICQAADLGTLGDSNEFVKRGASEDTEGSVPIASDSSKCKVPDSAQSTIAAPESSRKSDTADLTAKDVPANTSLGSGASLKNKPSEFVSDSFQTNEQDLAEVQAGMKTLGIDSLARQANESIGQEVEKTEEQWEKDLEAELQDYELVNDGSNERNANWEKDVDELLDDDETDLK
ncbi:synapse-associated protein of 47 kDa isoform X2 [Anopheles darlingi]|nr:synapse-associated protein of 47 kDa isoform X2 [Anopheles darlingi]XP_049533562.1 synapse-associated protein of 47 kDa isoform X2 [Anopheles darlingi]XP_049533564.1 synapse-associated protein of 47 kDa isoform X2 [Anopheles darlingi]XP_049533565.1 synapse-associated protein of 47 kDa isoform X2 [Anopheles darlingi]XP_049533566.1 synapse-associated protein of 47 kDa isoform X2 [Anopheles darlingi]XP_049533567.1 synapse-associated protein of 47 kDa isoform X2 [Anopheles darlingi]XP_04953356